MTLFKRPLHGIGAAACLLLLVAHGQDQHDYAETEIPCGIRCALGAAALLSVDGKVPSIDPASIEKLPARGKSLLDVKRFMRDHGMAGKAYADVPIDSLAPSPDAPVILQLSPDWLEHAVEPRQGIALDSDGLPHFVLAVKRDGDELLVWDVSVGHETIPLAELEPFFTGHAMTVHRRPQLLGGLLRKYGMSAYLAGGAIALLGAAALLRYVKARRRISESVRSNQTTA